MVRPVGGSSYRQVDVRVIAATNRDLREEVARKTFREDLFFRLAVIRVQLPALRERGRDIDLLTDSFIERFPAAQATVAATVGTKPPAQLQLARQRPRASQT